MYFKSTQGVKLGVGILSRSVQGDSKTDVGWWWESGEATVDRGSLASLFGDGSQTRDFVYIDDVVDALVRAGQAESVNRCIFNIGCGVEVSISGLVDTIEQVTGRRVHRPHNGKEEVGVSRLVADISLGREKLGYNPKAPLAQGLRLTMMHDPRFSAV